MSKREPGYEARVKYARSTAQQGSSDIGLGTDIILTGVK